MIAYYTNEVTVNFTYLTWLVFPAKGKDITSMYQVIMDCPQVVNILQTES